MQSQEATLAALVERVSALTRSFDEFRENAKEERVETRAQFERIRAETQSQFEDFQKKVQEELDPLRETQKETNRIMNKAAGGYLVLVGLAGILTWATGAFERIWKLWSQ